LQLASEPCASIVILGQLSPQQLYRDLAAVGVPPEEDHALATFAEPTDQLILTKLGRITHLQRAGVRHRSSTSKIMNV
jgi:hypothetical protein